MRKLTWGGIGIVLLINPFVGQYLVQGYEFLIANYVYFVLVGVLLVIAGEIIAVINQPKKKTRPSKSGMKYETTPVKSPKKKADK